MSSMRGAKVAILESRMSSELARLIARHGGEPVCVPALRETPLVAEVPVRELLSGVLAGRLPFVILLTGVAVTVLFDQAERCGLRSQLVTALKSTTTIARGPKPQAALR